MKLSKDKYDNLRDNIGQTIETASFNALKIVNAQLGDWSVYSRI